MMKTADQALAECLARGTRTPAQCAEVIAAQSVGGVYCDGTIVQTADGKRCVPRALADRVDRVSQQSPLAPTTPSSSVPSSSLVPWIVGGALALAVVVVLARR